MATVSDILKQSKGFDLLKEVETLLCDYLEVDSAGLFLKREEDLPSNVETLVQMNINSLKEGYPLAYIRGKQDFYGLEFKVSKSVLIPRRDTEVLVSEAINCIQKLFKSCEIENEVKMLELGVGSGCISISIAKNIDGHFSVLGVEKSREALDIAHENVNIYGLSEMISLREGDLLDGIDGDFNVLVANLPYIPYESEDFGVGVKEHEPHLALFAEDGGLALYRRVLEQISEKDMGFRAILFEIGFDQGNRALKMCKEFGFNSNGGYEISIVKDMEDRDRVVRIVST